MPAIGYSAYKPSWRIANPHLQTIYPSLLRKVSGVQYEREQINTPDDDFLDLDFCRVGARRIVVALHGLEGDSTRSYILGMVKALNRRGWDVAALNFRGCGGAPNRVERMYHSGETKDLQTVISHIEESREYDEIALVGFSLGGNVILKYLGERGPAVDDFIRGAAAISVPCDLAGCSDKMEDRENTLYVRRFLRLLYDKMVAKSKRFPDKVSVQDYNRMTTLRDFDDRYTAPIHGFADAAEYYEKSSSKQFLSRIAVPTLILNAQDDPFLSPSCFPTDEAEASRHVYLEAPCHGGHCGFVSFGRDAEYYSESRAGEFLQAASWLR